MPIPSLQGSVRPLATHPSTAAVLSLCARAFDEDVAPRFETFTKPTHVLGYDLGALVSHALRVTRWLQPEDLRPLSTAYVEMVATDPGHRRRGFATQVMRRLAKCIVDYELGALCPADPRLYLKLGWRLWRGPLFIRRRAGSLIPTPQERVMILRLPKTPPLNLDAPLSAEWRPGELW